MNVVKENSQPISVFWFRRDLRLSDNVGLAKAQSSGRPVLPIFIFDPNILNELDKDDARVTFIHKQLEHINAELQEKEASLLVLHERPEAAWDFILNKYNVKEVFVNRDYEPYGMDRDTGIKEKVEARNATFHSFKDQVICEYSEVLKADGLPYTIYTPYKNKWLGQTNLDTIEPISEPTTRSWFRHFSPFKSLKEIGFTESNKHVRPYDISQLDEYETIRNFPGIDGTSYLGPHLRFGTIGIRTLFKKVKSNQTFVSELIWREFFMQVLFHFPAVVEHNFKRKYDGIEWRNDTNEFQKWCEGKTGYPMVDAGMRQLNQTGYIHNRVRMVVASFLCKHLLIDWKWGEAYFAKHLLDYELASNNGNWQWAAGTGCDSAPYFRVFNPSEQLKKFDNQMSYIKKWVPEIVSGPYNAPMVDHKKARIRAIETYKTGIST